MTDTAHLPSEPPASRRGRFQRRLRRASLTSGRDSFIGLVVSVLVVVGGHTTGLFEGSAAAAPEAPGDEVVFTAAMVGDLMYARHVERVAERHGHRWLLEPVEPLLRADYVTGNLEQVVSDRVDELPEADKLIHLASDRRAAEALAEAGFTTLALANNHLMDHGIPGLRDTIEILDDVGLAHAGAGETIDDAMSILYEERGDLTVATLSFTDAFVVGFVARAFQGGVLSADIQRASRLIRQANANADLVVAHFHWGQEYAFVPDGTQRDLAEMAAASGADIVIGHHPHVLQSVERIGNTLVLFSLGNFVFDQGWTRTRESTLVRYHLADDGEARVEFVPIIVREGAPRVVDGPLAGYHRERIFHRLRGDGLTWGREGDRLVTTIDHSHVLEAATERVEVAGR